MTFGEKIKKLRLEKGWTQEQLAQKIGRRMRAIVRYESGESYPRYRETYYKLAELFDVEVNYLLTENEEFMAEVGEQYGRRGQLQAEEVLNQARELFAGGELSEDDRMAFLLDLHEIFLESKKIAREKFTPKKYRKTTGQDEPQE